MLSNRISITLLAGWLNPHQAISAVLYPGMGILGGVERVVKARQPFSLLRTCPDSFALTKGRCGAVSSVRGGAEVALQ